MLSQGNGSTGNIAWNAVHTPRAGFYDLSRWRSVDEAAVGLEDRIQLDVPRVTLGIHPDGAGGRYQDLHEGRPLSSTTTDLIVYRQGDGSRVELGGVGAVQFYSTVWTSAHTLLELL